MNSAWKTMLGACLLCLATASPVAALRAADILQCVPYARELSGIGLRGDAWTWWNKAEGRYSRGQTPRVGSIMALASSTAMPLGHVAVVSHIIDERRVLLRHANWSGPGVIENDVLAVDSSADNNWSRVRVWWGRTQQLGARDNPVHGFIYPGQVSDRAVFAGFADPGANRRMLASIAARPVATAPKPVQPITTASLARQPRLTIDPHVFVALPADKAEIATGSRNLAEIIADIRRENRLL